MTRGLISDAAGVFEGYRDRIPLLAIADTNQAGRCLAFDLPIAAGFHIARATEGVIKRAMEVFDCPPLKDSQRSWGHYIKSLRDKGGNPKTLHHLEQLKDLHRNPLVHPEVTLMMPEALALWSLCTSAIQALVADMEIKAAMPYPGLINMLPAEATE